MKNRFLIIATVLALITTACCNNDKCEAPKDEKSKSVKQEQISTQKKKTKEKNTSLYELKNGSVLGVKPGSEINAQKLDKGLKVSYSTEERQEEGETYKYKIALISDEDGKLLKVELTDDNKANDIKIVSSRIKVKKEIGVNSTVEDFLKKYKDATIQYSYVGGYFWLSSKELPKVQFIFEEKGYTGKKDKLMESDWVILSPKDIKPETKIVWIRLY